MSIYDFTVKTNRGVEKKLSDYEGQVVLIVNTASKCGFTPQFEGLQKLYEKYQDKGFVILGFPCNQFDNQDPGTNEEIQQACKLNYGVNFPLFEKGDVRGETAQPLFKYLTSQKGFQGFESSHPLTKILLGFMKTISPTYLTDEQIKWNFTKFLIDRKGQVVARFEPTTEPKSIEKDIEALL